MAVSAYPYLGSDVMEDEKHRIVLAPTKDVEHVSELDNMAQAIKRRLKTPLGFYQREPFYGSRVPSYVGRGNSKDLQAAIKDAIIESLTREPRIDKILEVSANPAPDLALDSNPYSTLRIGIRIKLVGKAPPLSFVYSFFLPTGDLESTSVAVQGQIVAG